MEVIFLRHAKTDLNGKGYIATKKDYFLNEIGREECLRNVFPPNSFNRVYCSSYKRTVETVKIVYPYLDPVIFSDLTQRDLGELNEKMEKDIDDLYVFLAKYCRIPDKTILLVDDYNKCIYHKRDMDATERTVIVMKDADILIKICDSTGDFDDTSEYQLLIRLLKERTIIEDGGSRRLRQKRGS